MVWRSTFVGAGGGRFALLTDYGGELRSGVQLCEVGEIDADYEDTDLYDALQTVRALLEPTRKSSGESRDTTAALPHLISGSYQRDVFLCVCLSWRVCVCVRSCGLAAGG